MIDCSHGNSGRDHRRSPAVAADVAGQVAAGQPGIAGVMLESFLVAAGGIGDPARLVYGQSVTDGCSGTADTAAVLAALAAAARARRAARAAW